jgi:hypothetical protein
MTSNLRTRRRTSKQKPPKASTVCAERVPAAISTTHGTGCRLRGDETRNCPRHAVVDRSGPCRRRAPFRRCAGLLSLPSSRSAFSPAYRLMATKTGHAAGWPWLLTSKT